MDTLSVVVPLPSHKLDAALRWVSCQDRITEVCKDAIAADQTACFELRCVFQNRHVFRSHFSSVNYAVQSILRPDTIYVLLAVQHTASAGSTAEVAAIPLDGELLILHRHGFKTHAAKTGSNFSKIAELRGSILILYFVILLQTKNKPEYPQKGRFSGFHL